MMTMLKKTALFAALPLAAGLWFTPIASAHDSDWRYRHHQPEGSYSTPYRHSWRYRGENSRYSSEDMWKYNKAMNRLARQEHEAQAKAYRRYDGNTSNPRYQERLAEIDRKYDQK